MRVLMYGIGSVGSTMTRMLVERGATIVGAVAASPEKNGKDVGELIGLDEPRGVRVYTDPDEALALKPDIVVMSIASYMEDMYEPIKQGTVALSRPALAGRSTAGRANRSF
jgi:hypothetical protein